MPTQDVGLGIGDYFSRTIMNLFGIALMWFAVMAALNFCHALTLEKNKNQQYSETMDQRIRMLQSTIEEALQEQGKLLRR